MGGRNHQPCRSYLKNSTKLSRCLSLAYAELELSNIALEDIIIQELEGENGSIVDILSHLSLSRVALIEAKNASASLQAQMDELKFEDLPPLKTLDLDALGFALVNKNCVNPKAWEDISSKMRIGGFRTVIEYFTDICIKSLEEKTTTLTSQIEALESSATVGDINIVLEENQSGNIRCAFADLYNSWSNFNQEFLASSLLSTEVWYVFNGYGSLVEFNSYVRVA